MKAFFLTSVLVIAVSLTAAADNFQFFYQSGNNFYYASYESVKLYDAGNRLVFSGFTDKYGRIAIKLNSGNFTCKVMYRKTEYATSISISNRTGISKVYFGRAMRPYSVRVL